MASMRLLPAVVVVVVVVVAGLAGTASGRSCTPQLLKEGTGTVWGVGLDEEGRYGIVVLDRLLHILQACDGSLVKTVPLKYRVGATQVRRMVRKSVAYLPVSGRNPQPSVLVVDFRDVDNVQQTEFGTKSERALHVYTEVVGDKLYVTDPHPMASGPFECVKIYDVGQDAGAPTLVQSVSKPCVVGASVMSKVLEGVGEEILVVADHVTDKVAVYDVASDTATVLDVEHYGMNLANRGKVMFVGDKQVDLANGNAVGDVGYWVGAVDQDRMFAWRVFDQGEAVVLDATQGRAVLGEVYFKHLSLTRDLVLTGEGKEWRLRRWTCGPHPLNPVPCVGETLATVEVDPMGLGQWEGVVGEVVAGREETLSVARVPPGWREGRSFVIAPFDKAGGPGPLDAGVPVRVTCPTLCEVFVAVHHCPPCTGGSNGGFPASLPSQGWDARGCAPMWGTAGGSRRMTSFRQQLDAGKEVVLLTDRPLDKAVVFVVPLREDCSAHTDETGCAAKSPLCVWREGTCVREWCPRPTSPRAPTPSSPCKC